MLRSSESGSTWSSSSADRVRRLSWSPQPPLKWLSRWKKPWCFYYRYNFHDGVHFDLSSITRLTPSLHEISYVFQLLRQGGGSVVEPIMDLEVVAEEDHMTSILADLNNRRGVVVSLGFRQNFKVPSARLTLHSTKLCTKFKIFRKKKYFLLLRLPLRHF